MFVYLEELIAMLKLKGGSNLVLASEPSLATEHNKMRRGFVLVLVVTIEICVLSRNLLFLEVQQKRISSHNLPWHIQEQIGSAHN